MVSIAVEDRTKASLAELRRGEGKSDLFFSIVVFCLSLLQVMPKLQKYAKFTFMQLDMIVVVALVVDDLKFLKV